MIIVGNKMYEVCPKCAKIVQLNKFILGSTHICASDEEYNNPEIRKVINARYEQNKKMIGG